MKKPLDESRRRFVKAGGLAVVGGFFARAIVTRRAYGRSKGTHDEHGT